MLARIALRTLAAPSSRFFSSSASRQTKVAVLGAGGGIGQPLSLLLKCNPLVTKLSLYDIRGAPGVAADVSHVDTASEVGFLKLNLAGFTETLTTSFRLTVILPTNLIRLLRMSRLLSSLLVFLARYIVYHWSLHSFKLIHLL